MSVTTWKETTPGLRIIEGTQQVANDLRERADSCALVAKRLHAERQKEPIGTALYYRLFDHEARQSGEQCGYVAALLLIKHATGIVPGDFTISGRKLVTDRAQATVESEDAPEGVNLDRVRSLFSSFRLALDAEGLNVYGDNDEKAGPLLRDRIDSFEKEITGELRVRYARTTGRRSYDKPIDVSVLIDDEVVWSGKA